VFDSNRESEVGRLLEAYRSTRPLRAGSLIVTVFGDAIAPHGGCVWLGSLIHLLAPFGLSQRLVRTTVFRLVREEWLEARQLGRRSYYRLTDIGRQRIATAQPRIYAPVEEAWDGFWDLVMLTATTLDADSRRHVTRELQWQGFGVVSTGVLAHPAGDLTAVRRILDEAGVLDRSVILRARCEESECGALRGLTASCWDLPGLEALYHRFLERFGPVREELSRARHLDPERCLLVRTLLIHEFRRVLLRDPRLPAELLPPDWIGTAARLLCRDLYQLVQEPAERHLMAVLETVHGALPQAESGYFRRFGGLGTQGRAG